MKRRQVFVAIAALCATATWPVPRPGENSSPAAPPARLRIVAPPPQAEVRGCIEIAAELKGAELVGGCVVFTVDGRTCFATNAAPYVYEWDTTREVNGKHCLKLQVFRRGERIAESTVVPVVVRNDGSASEEAQESLEAEEPVSWLRQVVEYVFPVSGDVASKLTERWPTGSPLVTRAIVSPGTPEAEGTGQSESVIKVTVDGELLAFTVQPMIRKGYVLAPVRSMFESLGATVHWVSDTKTAVARTPKREVRLKVNDPSARVNGQRVMLGVAPELSPEGVLMAPLQVCRSAFAARVHWQTPQRTIAIRRSLS